ncbi:uncharacterized protein LOC118761427 [Octopus sinensis]|uniref:Uncharacterized protein LOC118761427 n=1 Tax=Octopus sinensis TaxID=2607531 RepID=A0A7E6EIP0_9MOLL|nr:uncharacterized protein LOC118761427 [Octopus sinensis]
MPTHAVTRLCGLCSVINVSSRYLESSEEAVLNKGLNFATTTKRILYLDIIAPIEEITVNIPKAQGDELRWKVRQVLGKVKFPKPNITNEEKFAIKRLQIDNSIIILPAGKGNTTVVMNKSDYFEKLATFLSETNIINKYFNKRDTVLTHIRFVGQLYYNSTFKQNIQIIH